MDNGIMRKLFYLMFLVVLAGNASGHIWDDGDPCDHLWSSPLNWDFNTVPNFGVSACIGSAAVCITTCEIDASMTGASRADCKAVYGPGCYTCPGTATLNINGELSTNGGVFWMGHQADTTGITNISGSGDVNCGVFNVGSVNTSNGTLNMTGGTVTATYLRVGAGAGATGLVTIGAGSINTTVGELAVGYSGTGTVSMTGGTVTTAGNCWVGGLNGSDGTLTMDGGTITVPEFYVGLNPGSTGQATIDDGSITTTGLFCVGNGAQGSMTMSGGSITGGANFYLGRSNGAQGSLDMSGGSINAVGGSLLTGVSIGGNGSMVMSDGTLDAGHIAFGWAGTGSLTMTGGTMTANGNFIIANPDFVGTSAGDVNMVGGTITANELIIGTAGLMDIKAGTLILAGDDRTIVNGYINDGQLTGYGKSKNVQVYYDGSNTIVTADVNIANYAYAPSPYDGETVPAWDFNDVNLIWAPGESAAIHRIYFGEDFDDVNDANTSTAGIYKGEQNLDANEFDPGPLALDQSYYWRIDEVNDVDEWKGQVWMFTVHALIDDFESYADTAALQAVWDSNGALETGPKVGGYGSNQSMAIAYNNTSSPYYTEVTRDYGSDKDWTVLDIESLELYFHGDKGNAADKIYVKLDDGTNSKAIYYDDPNAITEYWKWWQVQRIELADFSAGGVDLSKVRKITIGVSQEPPAAGGGSGTVYVDNIRLYPPTCFVDDALTKGGLVGDCEEVDFDDLDEMVSDWLVSGVNVPAVAPATGSVAWYKFDETSGTDASDSSGNGYTATVNKDTAWDTGGYYNGCLDFDGSVNVTAPAGTFSTIDKQITVSVWVNGDASQPVCDHLFKADAGGVCKCFVAYAWPRNELACHTAFHTSYQPLSEDVIWTPVEPWQYAGQWNHYAFVKNADEGLQSIYLNGVLVAQEDECFGSMAGVDTVTIGGYPGRYFNGKLDDFRIYDYALSQAEIVSLSDQASVYQPVLSDADIDDDDSVDFKDFAILAENWFTQPLWP